MTIIEPTDQRLYIVGAACPTCGAYDFHTYGTGPNDTSSVTQHKPGCNSRYGGPVKPSPAVARELRRLWHDANATDSPLDDIGETLAACLPVINGQRIEAERHLAQNIAMQHTPGIAQWTQTRDALLSIEVDVGERLRRLGY